MKGRRAGLTGAGIRQQTIIELIRESGLGRWWKKEFAACGGAFFNYWAVGRKKGRTKAQFFRDEQQALKPHQPGLCDDFV